jgi:hypothetical protein
MTLTPEERAEINRQNGKKSRGPATPEGKAVSRRNAIRHGLRSEVLAVEGEDPEVVQARADAWNDYYQPQSPAAQHLVTECVRATLLADRVHKANTAAISRQIRSAAEAWDHTRDDQVEGLKRQLMTDPAEAVRLLKHTSEGCFYLLSRWEVLDGTLQEQGHWTGPERDEAIRLLGFDPNPETLANCPEAWLTRLYNLLCRENATDSAIDWMLHPERMPEKFRGTYRAEWLPDSEDSLGHLRDLIAEQVAFLKPEGNRLEDAFDGPDRDDAPARAAVVLDPVPARLLLRYQAEARTSFHRSYSELVKTLDRDRAERAESAQSSTDTAPVPTPTTAPAPEPVSPNEPTKLGGRKADSPNEPASDRSTPMFVSLPAPGADPVAPVAAAVA